MDWFFIGVRVEKIFHSFAALIREIFFNTRREISYLRAAMQYPFSISLSLSLSLPLSIYINFLLPKKRGRLCIVICLVMTGSVLNLSPFRKKFLRNGLKVYSGGNFKKIPLSWSNFACFFFSCSSFLLNFDSSSFNFSSF